MTRQKHLKRRVRERMEKTGESYTTARLHILGRPQTPFPDATRAPHRRDTPAPIRVRIRKPGRRIPRALVLPYVAPVFTILLTIIVSLTGFTLLSDGTSTSVGTSIQSADVRP